MSDQDKTRAKHVNMEKSPIASHKSHMSGGTRVPARSSRDARACPAAERVTAGPRAKGARSANCGSAATGTRGGKRPRTADADTCMVDPSAWDGPAAWFRARRGMTETGSRARLATQATDRRTGTARGSVIPIPERGARRGAGGWHDRWQSPPVTAHGARRHETGKGQGAYFPADGTDIQEPAGRSRLSRCESPIYAQDLQSTTLSNLAYTKSKIFGFVMT